jgi:hypothetical protein
LGPLGAVGTEGTSTTPLLDAPPARAKSAPVCRTCDLTLGDVSAATSPSGSGVSCPGLDSPSCESSSRALPRAVAECGASLEDLRGCRAAARKLPLAASLPLPLDPRGESPRTFAGDRPRTPSDRTETRVGLSSRAGERAVGEPPPRTARAMRSRANEHGETDAFRRMRKRMLRFMALRNTRHDHTKRISANKESVMQQVQTRGVRGNFSRPDSRNSMPARKGKRPQPCLAFTTEQRCAYKPHPSHGRGNLIGRS